MHCEASIYGSAKIDETKEPTWDGINVMHIPHRINNTINRLELAHGFVEINQVMVPDVMKGTDPRAHLPYYLTRKASKTGLFFEKQSYDVFTNPAFEVFLEMADVEEAIVYGVATDYCVKAAVLGMQERGIQCYVVEDAIKGVDPETTKSALEEMVNAGAKFVKTEEVLEGKI